MIVSIFFFNYMVIKMNIDRELLLIKMKYLICQAIIEELKTEFSELEN